MSDAKSSHATLRLELHVLRETGQVARLTLHRDEKTEEDIPLPTPLYVSGLPLEPMAEGKAEGPEETYRAAAEETHTAWNHYVRAWLQAAQAALQTQSYKAAAPYIGQPAIQPGIAPSIQPGIAPHQYAMSPAINPGIGSALGPAIHPGIGSAMGPAIQPGIGFAMGPAIQPGIGLAMGPAINPGIASAMGPAIAPQAFYYAAQPSIAPGITPAIQSGIRPAIAHGTTPLRAGDAAKPGGEK